MHPNVSYPEFLVEADLLLSRGLRPLSGQQMAVMGYYWTGFLDRGEVLVYSGAVLLSILVLV
jgi:hypothetical protein